MIGRIKQRKRERQEAKARTTYHPEYPKIIPLRTDYLYESGRKKWAEEDEREKIRLVRARERARLIEEEQLRIYKSGFVLYVTRRGKVQRGNGG